MPEIIDKMQIIVSRKWNNPQIHVEISQEGVEMKLDINDFIEAFRVELKKERFWTRSGALKRLDEVVSAVIKEMKDSTLKVLQ